MEHASGRNASKHRCGKRLTGAKRTLPVAPADKINNITQRTKQTNWISCVRTNADRYHVEGEVLLQNNLGEVLKGEVLIVNKRQILTCPDPLRAQSESKCLRQSPLQALDRLVYCAGLPLLRVQGVFCECGGALGA